MTLDPGIERCVRRDTISAAPTTLFLGRFRSVER